MAFLPRWFITVTTMLPVIMIAVSAQQDILPADTPLLANGSVVLPLVMPEDSAGEFLPPQGSPAAGSSDELELTLVLLFFLLLLALLFFCALYSVCGQSSKCRVLRRMESQSFDAMITGSANYFREDLVNDDEILRLWICVYCDFANYEIKSHCALCGNDKCERQLAGTPRSKAQSIRPASLFSSLATTISSSSRSLSPSFLLGSISPSQSRLGSSPIPLTPSPRGNGSVEFLSIRIDPRESSRTTTASTSAPEPPSLTPRSPSGTPFALLKRRKEWQPIVDASTGDAVWMHCHTDQGTGDEGTEAAPSGQTALPQELVIQTAFVAHNVITPDHPHGHLQFLEARGARVYGPSRSEYASVTMNAAALDPLAINALRALSFPEKHRYFMQETTSILHVRWGNPTLPTTSGADDNGPAASMTTLVVPRDDLFHGTMKALISVSQRQLHRPLRVKFLYEPGIDAGGIAREWFSLVMAEFLDEKNGLFKPVHTNANTQDGHSDGCGLAYTIHPTASITVANHLLYFRAFGRLLGKALLEGHLIPVPLADFLLKHILSVPVSFADLQALDEGLARSLLLLWQTPLLDLGEDEEDEDPYALDFSVYHTAEGVVDLKENGRNIAVTEANKLEYIALYTKWHLGQSVADEIAALVSGVYDAVPVNLLAPFDPQELRLMLCGSPSVDVADWHKHTVVMGKRSFKTARVVAWFWKIVRDMPTADQCRLLQFATGAARVPVQGFKALTSSDGRLCPFTIYCVPKDECAYIRAYTCFNRLDLPLYKSEKELAISLQLVLQMDITGFSIQ
jgi:hypothetical protein